MIFRGWRPSWPASSPARGALMSQAPEPSAPEAEGMAGPKVGWQAGSTSPSHADGDSGDIRLCCPHCVTGSALASPQQLSCPAEVVSLPCANPSPAQPPSHLRTRHTFCPKTEVRGSTASGSGRSPDPVPIATPSPGLLSVLLSKELGGGWLRRWAWLGLNQAAWPGASVLFLASGGARSPGVGNMQACALQRGAGEKPGPLGVS